MTVIADWKRLSSLLLEFIIFLYIQEKLWRIIFVLLHLYINLLGKSKCFLQMVCFISFRGFFFFFSNLFMLIEMNTEFLDLVMSTDFSGYGMSTEFRYCSGFRFFKPRGG